MRQAKNGDTVRVNFEGRLENGTEFASTKENDPLELVIGKGKLIPGFEQGIVGMKPGDKKTVNLKPEQAFGERRPELVTKIPVVNIPDDIAVDIGVKLQLKDSNGELRQATVTDMSDQFVTVDANAPLAGQALSIDLELVDFA